MIRRHFTADCINVVANDPSVYPWVRGYATGKLDLSPAVENPNNYLLMGEYGGVLFQQLTPGLYEAHTQVLPAGRGAWTLDMVNEALEWMFTKTDCIDITTRCPLNNIQARALAKAIGGRKEYRLEQGWVFEGQIVPADIYSLQVQGWMSRAPGLEQWGKKFHERLESEYKSLGHDHGANHEDDPVHDRYVGATYLMIRNGQLPKALIMYNRWCAMSGYLPVSVVSMDPVVLDIQESLLAVKDGDFFVLRVK